MLTTIQLPHEVSLGRVARNTPLGSQMQHRDQGTYPKRWMLIPGSFWGGGKLGSQTQTLSLTELSQKTKQTRTQRSRITHTTSLISTVSGLTYPNAGVNLGSYSVIFWKLKAWTLFYEKYLKWCWTQMDVWLISAVPWGRVTAHCLLLCDYTPFLTLTFCKSETLWDGVTCN